MLHDPPGDFLEMPTRVRDLPRRAIGATLTLLSFPERAMMRAARLLVVLLGAIAPAAAPAQTSKSDNRQIDLKPLLPPVIPPLPSSSVLAPGAVGSNAQSPHASSLYDSSQSSAPAPGFRFSIPTR